MKCPNCNETLIMADRQGIEIDYCPSCRGVWLDRGELDKIVERSASYTQQPNTSDFNREERPHSDSYKQQPYGNQQGHYNDPHYRHKKKKGFLSDFFDFD
jgi:Zn-finger nucleic acid-binding protein